MSAPASNNDSGTNTVLTHGGLIHALIRIFRNEKGVNLKKVAFWLAIVTWVPSCLLAIYSGTLNDTSETISFFEDFLFHVRFLLVLPFLIIMEKKFSESFNAYLKNTDAIVPANERKRFDRLIQQIRKLDQSVVPELLFLVIIYALTFTNWSSLNVFDSTRNYLTTDANTLSPAGWYYLLFCAPLLQLQFFRWFWRWVFWVYSLWKISRINIYLDVLHADSMSGLYYLNFVPLSFALLAGAISTVISAVLGIDIIYNGSSLTEHIIPIAAYVILIPVLLFLPLTLFMPKISKAMSSTIFHFGGLIREHNKKYSEKWLGNSRPKDDELVGNADHSSLADINGSYGPVLGSKLIPIDLRFLLSAIIINLVPFIPLIFTEYSVPELFRDILSNAFGS